MTTEEEIWIPIKGYETIKEVSNLGRIRQLPQRTTWAKGKHTTKSFIKDGYITYLTADVNGELYVNIKDNHTRQVKWLVASHFVPNPENYDKVKQKDGDKSNNRATNLEWYTNRLTKKQIDLINYLRDVDKLDGKAISRKLDIKYYIVTAVLTKRYKYGISENTEQRTT